MKNNKKLKGFTLVELLVVIAILAVLATVSVVGYTSFITKANNSNALTECKQAEDVILSDLISAGRDLDSAKTVAVDNGHITFKYSIGDGKVSIKPSDENGKATDDDTWPEYKLITHDELKKACSDLDEIKGYFFTGKLGEIYYITQNAKGIALWQTGHSPQAATKDAEKFLTDNNLNEVIDSLD